MEYKPVNAEREGSMITFEYENVDLIEFPKRLEAFFKAEGYKLESGTNEKGVYGKGSHLMRLLLGGFVKRYTFWVRLAGENTTVHFQFGSNMTGISGGVIGYGAMSAEHERLIKKIKTVGF